MAEGFVDLDWVDSSVDSSRLKTLIDRYIERFGGEYPLYIARSPGRVNLIGEHVDYSGYSVVPMAIEQDTMIAVGHGVEDSVIIANVNGMQWKEDTYEVSLPKHRLKEEHKWSNYVVCGGLGVLEDAGRSQSVPVRMMVDGRVPIGSGLSSSSAMVCCGALAMARINGINLNPTRTAAVAAQSERWIGMESGGMDQAISLLARKGSALHIQFDPIRVAPVPLSPDVAVVIVDSNVVSLKYATATTGYNLRVVECRFAAVVLAKRLGIPEWDTRVRRLRDLQELSGKSLPQLAELVRSLLRLGPWTLDEINQELGIKDAQERFGNPTLSGPYKIADRALHVFEESLRVERFVQPGVSAEEMGALMNGSHASCAKQFECSCDELDQLTDVCRRAGALGSRLTGAGWGGWTVNLVRTTELDAWIERVWAEYFLHQGKSVAKESVIIVSRPSGGACYFNVVK